MSKASTARRLRIKGFTSLLLAICFLCLGLSGIVLYLAPRGREAHWTDWRMLALDKEQWAAVHINLSLVVLIAGGVHLYLNWRTFWGYLRREAVAGVYLKRELAAAVILLAVLLPGTLWHVPPFGSVLDLNDWFKTYWARRSPQAPVPHADEFSLKRLAAELDIPAEELAEALRREGFPVEDTAVKLRQLARAKGVAPFQVYEIIRRNFPDAGPESGPGPAKGRGPGRRPRRP